MNISVTYIEGWMIHEDLLWLEKTIQKLPEKAFIVELGAWKGRSTGAIATTILPSQTFVTIDTWLGQPDSRFTVHKEATEKDIFLSFLGSMCNLGKQPTWYKGQKCGFYYLRMESLDAPSLFADGTIDLIFIDADHTKIGQDIDAWYDKIKPDGIICGHDYQWDGAKQAIDGRLNVTEIYNSLWLAKKTSPYGITAIYGGEHIGKNQSYQ